jgi:Transposase IS200 like
MARPLRIEFPGAVYHVTSRGDRREAIFDDDADRHAFLNVIAQATERFDAAILAYCLMDNHYHLVIHTRRGNLSRLRKLGSRKLGSGLASCLIPISMQSFCYGSSSKNRISRRRLPRHLAETESWGQALPLA